jgi:tetratricopeptide (TPR) repeat protein
MRYAVILSPWDPDEPEIAAWSSSVSWLTSTLASLGFRVVPIDGRGDVQSKTARALAEVGPTDSLLLHVSGRLARRGVLALAGGGWLPFRVIGEMLKQRGGCDVTVLTELVHDDDSSDPLFASDQVDAVVSALEARERGYGVVAALRQVSAEVTGLAFTRLLMKVARAAQPEDAVMSRVFGRAAAMPERLVTVQAIAFERGAVDLSLAQQRPSDPELDVLVAQATDARDWRRVVDLRRMRIDAHDSDRARVRELVSIARILQAELDDAEGAIEALEEARTIDPTRVPVLQALRRGYERLGRWASAIETVSALAGLALTPSDRAELHFARARLVLERLQDDERAIELLNEVLQDDPAHERARAALRELLAWRDEAEELDEENLEDDEEEEALEPEAPDEPAPEAAANAVDPDPAPQSEYGDEITADGEADSPVQAAAESDDSEQIGPTARARALGGDALDAVTHARAFAEHRREGRTDRAYLAALALEELGAADVDQQILIDQFRGVAPIRARTGLDAAGWTFLRAPGNDPAIDALFGAVARAAVSVRLEELIAHNRLVELDPETRVDEKSTALVGRTFHWAARVLAVPCPGLYLVDQVPGDIATVRARKPATAVGPSVVRGRSPKELAFLAGRHLAYYKPEHQVVVYYPTRQDLIRLLFAAVQIVRPRTTPPEGMHAPVLCKAIARKLRDHERGALFDAVRLLESRGGKASIGAWTRGVELTAARAGLFLSGDLETAMSLVRGESRAIADLTFEEKRRDLVAFCSSEAHAELRRRYAVIAPESVKPPPFVAGRARESAAAFAAPE